MNTHIVARTQRPVSVVPAPWRDTVPQEATPAAPTIREVYGPTVSIPAVARPAVKTTKRRFHEWDQDALRLAWEAQCKRERRKPEEIRNWAMRAVAIELEKSKAADERRFRVLQHLAKGEDIRISIFTACGMPEGGGYSALIMAGLVEKGFITTRARTWPRVYSITPAGLEELVRRLGGEAV